jgi:hypothetical protein
VYHSNVTHDAMNFNHMTNDIYMTSDMYLDLEQATSFDMYINLQHVAYYNKAIKLVPTI